MTSGDYVIHKNTRELGYIMAMDSALCDVRLIGGREHSKIDVWFVGDTLLASSVYEDDSDWGDITRSRIKTRPPRPCIACGTYFAPRHILAKRCRKGCGTRFRRNWR